MRVVRPPYKAIRCSKKKKNYEQFLLLNETCSIHNLFPIDYMNRYPMAEIESCKSC